MSNLRSLLWRWAARFAFWSGVVPIFAWYHRTRRPRSWTVVTYHRVGSPAKDGGPDAVSPQRFRRQVRYLRRRYEICPVGEALERLKISPRLSRPLLSITFDDGYYDNVAVALPILQEERCRATLYATLEAVREGLPPWPHRLAVDLMVIGERARNAVPANAGSVARHAVLKDFMRQTSRECSLTVVQRTVDRARSLPESERLRLCEESCRLSGAAGERAARMLGPEGLARWSAAGMTVGSHTCRHSILSRQTREERLHDLEESRCVLEQTLGTPILDLAYPNGRPADWDQEVAADARATGYRSAATTIEGINGAGLDPWAVRRISVGNDTIPVFAARLSGLFAGIRAWHHVKTVDLSRRSPAISGQSGLRAPLQSPGRRLRIAFIGGRGVGGAYSGIERYYEELGCRLAARGHRVVVYCRSHFSPQVRRFRGMEVRRVPTARSKHLETLLHTLICTFDACFRRLDVVQFHALGSSPFSWIPRLAGKKTVVSVRGLDWQRAKWGRFARACLKLCERTSIHCPTATTVVSKTLRDHFQGRFGRAVRYIPNGVGVLDPSPPDVIRRWGLGESDYLLYAGRLSPEKGLETLIEAHRALKPSRLLVIAGGSSYAEPYLQRLSKQAGAGVVFTGFQSGRALQELYSNALAFVLPSHMEGLSVALLEAMAYGLPVVASDIPENRELIDQCGGYLFREGNVEDLMRVLRSIVSDPAGALRLGRSTRQKVRAQFDWDRIAVETERFYFDLLGADSCEAQAADEARVA